MYHQFDYNAHDRTRGRPYGSKCWIIKKSINIRKVTYHNEVVSSIEIGGSNEPRKPDMVIIGVYMPYDNHSLQCFIDFKSNLELVKSLLEEHVHDRVVILGDFNSDINRGNSNMMIT